MFKLESLYSVPDHNS